jgi:hypothetical protein
VFDNTNKQAHLIDVAIPNSDTLHSAIVEELQKYRDLKGELIRIWQLNTPCIIPSVLSTTHINTNNYTKV